MFISMNVLPVLQLWSIVRTLRGDVVNFKECAKLMLVVCGVGVYLGFLLLCASLCWKFLDPVTFWQRSVAFVLDVLLVGVLAFLCAFPLSWVIDKIEG